PRFDPNHQIPNSQRRQCRYVNDYLSIHIAGNDSNLAVLFANQEYTNDAIMYPDDMDEADQRAISREAHGLTVVELARTDEQSTWKVDVNGAKNRRFLIDTEYEFTGPAAGSDLLRTKEDPHRDRGQGTLGNCAG